MSHSVPQIVFNHSEAERVINSWGYLGLYNAIKTSKVVPVLN